MQLFVDLTHPISIHAPTRGATRCELIFRQIRCNFNPRSHTGSDLPGITDLSTRIDFNPRSHTGSDQSVLAAFPILQEFQSTLPHGERHAAVVVAAPRVTFQSTLPHGERHHIIKPTQINIIISIHAPTRGATLLLLF